MKIIEIQQALPSYVTEIQKLLPQLSNSKIDFSMDELEAMLAASGTHLFAAVSEEKSEKFLGMFTMTIYRIPTGLNARIDDVVVDDNARGQGIGEQLMRHAIKVARQSGVTVINLTSNPRRKAANRLYQRLGFEQYQTNFYRFNLLP